MIEYRKGQPGEMADILDFGNYVFSQAHNPHDFSTLVPKVYGPGKTTEDLHFLALEDDRIKGMVAVYPHSYQVGNEELKTGFIGTVSVHPYSRGSGYMKRLMKDADEAMIADGVDLAFLGGLRQRYQYYGYEKGGMTIRMQVSQTNFRHVLRDTADAIYLLPVEEDDTELIQELYPFYTQRRIQGRTAEEFYETMKTWNSLLYAVIDDTTCIGYLSTSQDGRSIQEIEIQDYTLIPNVLRAHAIQHDVFEMSVSLAAYETEKIAVLEPVVESIAIIENEQIKIFNWPKVLKALLELKASHTDLANGTLTLEIIGYGRFRIEVMEQAVQVTATEECADWTLEPMEAVRKLTSSKILFLPPSDVTLPAGWFPLSFAMSSPDCF